MTCVPIQLKGKVFGRLTVLKETLSRKQHCIVWKCRCQCGNIKYIKRSKSA